MDKAPDAFRTISEVAEELDVPQHVLRFWESRFREIRPMKRGGGRRYYRPDDLDLLRGIRHLLYGEGYTIRGVQRLLREHGLRFVQNVWQPGAPQPFQQSADEDEPVERADVPARGGALRAPSPRGADDGEQLHAAAEPPGAPDPVVPPPPGLSREQLQKLQAALHDLAECRRLLDAVLREEI